MFWVVLVVSLASIVFSLLPLGLDPLIQGSVLAFGGIFIWPLYFVSLIWRIPITGGRLRRRRHREREEQEEPWSPSTGDLWTLFFFDGEGERG